MSRPTSDPAPIRVDPPCRTLRTFSALLTQLYQEGYTGPIVLHFANGAPKTAEFPQQIVPGAQITLV